MRYSLRREPRWNADKRARSKRARAASQGAAVVTLRLPAFRFLHLILEVLIWRSSTEERKAGPTPALSLDRTGFALDVTTFLQARDPFATARRKKLGRDTRSENGNACHESLQKLARGTPPSPQRGEGWGEGVRALQIVLRIPSPLILSFSPISAFTRVFDALWGRRDAACRPRHSLPLMRTPSPQRGEGWGEGVRKFEKKLQLPNPLILSFSPISAFTRVFDALWGRRDAACRPRSSSLFTRA